MNRQTALTEVLVDRGKRDKASFYALMPIVHDYLIRVYWSRKEMRPCEFRKTKTKKKRLWP